jgi:heptosyltransferase-2
MKILLLRFSSLGDIILTMPVAKALMQVTPKASVDLGTKSEYSNLFTHPSPFKNIIYLDDAGVVPFIKKINEQNYDIIMDLHRSIRTLAILPLLKASIKKGYKKGTIARRIFVKTGIKLSNFPGVVERYLNTLDITEIPEPPWFTFDEEERKIGRSILIKAGIYKDRIIGIAPGAKWRTKKWPLRHYVTLAQKLQNKPYDIAFIFGKGDEQDLKELLKMYPEARILTTEEHGLRNIAYAIALMDVFISSDTGLMHLAEASGIPLVAMFGPTTKEFGFFPVSKKAVVIEKPLACRPCSLHGADKCKYEHHRCMEDITVEEVEDTVIKLLTQKK